MILPVDTFMCFLIYSSHRNETLRYGRLAQLVRASGLHPGCREFDPLTVHQWATSSAGRATPF